MGTRDAPAPGASGDRGNARRPLNNPLPEASGVRPFPCALPSSFPSFPSSSFFFLSPFYPSFHPHFCSAAYGRPRSPLFVLSTPMRSDPGPEAVALAHCNQGAREGERQGSPHSKPPKGRSLCTPGPPRGRVQVAPEVTARRLPPILGPVPRTATTPRSPSGTWRPALSRARQGRAPPEGGT